MKKLPIVSLLLAATLTCSLTGCKDGDFKPWDNLGGGGVATDVTASDKGNSGDYLIDNAGGSDLSTDYDTTANDYFVINLNEIPTADLSQVSAYSYSSGVLTIQQGGNFELTGALSGVVEVSSASSDVCIILNNATINSLSFLASDNARVITIKEGTQNNVNYVEDVSDTGALIYASDTNLTINGSGTLNLSCESSVKVGVEVKMSDNFDTKTYSLNINGPIINVNNSKKSGLKSTKNLVIKNADITVVTDGDGIKTDMEPSTVEQAELFASGISYGYIYVEKSNLNLTCGDDGISAENCVFIANTDNENIAIITNSGAPATVTEISSDAADGKAIKTGGITYTDQNSVETDYPASYEENYGLVITGGKFDINSNDDAISSKGNLVISGGNFDLTTGDDGVHAEYLTKITGGSITVNKCYEGVEGASVEIMDGTIDITSVDDGINAANADLTGYTYYILIEGGNITVNAQGDGIDSNGTVKITGGNVFVKGPTDGANASLDADSGILVNGGNLLAVGPVGMIENPSTNSTQRYISLTLSSAQEAGTTITVKDSDGQTILSATPDKKYQSVIISLSDFTANATYTVTVGETSYSATLSQIGTALGSNSSGGGSQGMMPGGR